MRGQMQKVAAVEKRNNPDARGQQMFIQVFDFFMQKIEHVIGVCAFAQEHNAFDHVAVIEHFPVFAVDGARNLAQPDLWTLRDIGEIANADGGSVLGFDEGLPDIGSVSEEPHGANVHLLITGLNKAAASIDVVAC